MSARRAKIEKAGRSAAAGARDIRVIAAVAGLLLLHFVIAVSSAVNKSVTFDELAHLTRGVSYLKLGDYRLGPPHPPLAHYLAALPVMATNPRFPSLNQPAWKRSNVWSIGSQFFYQVGNKSDDMLFRGRCMIALLSVGVGLLVFLWSRSLFGLAGGLLSLILYAFSPTILAHASLVTTDFVSAAFFTASMAALWRVSHRLSWFNLVAAIFAVGFMFMSKGSGVLLGPMGLLLIAVRAIDRRPLVFALWGPVREIQSHVKRFGVLMAVTIVLMVTTDFMLWGSYGFRWSPFKDGGSTPEAYERDAKAGLRDYFSASQPQAGMSAWDWQMRGLGSSAKFCRFIHDHKLLPDAYAYGFLAMLQSARGRDSFLNGERTLFGSKGFFPYAFAVKTPLPLFGMLLLAAATMLKRSAVSGQQSARRDSSGNRELGTRNSELGTGHSLLTTAYATIPLWILLLVYGATSMRSTLNIGHRHLLPLYPALLILCGAAGAWLGRVSELKSQVSNSKLAAIMRYATFGVAGLFVLASLTTFPHYLSYFNYLAGGPANGYKHLVDSSLDWGQDLPSLARKLKADHAERTVYLKYFGMGSASHEGIVYRDIYQRLPSDGHGDLQLRGGEYCISATSFQQLYVLDTPEIGAIEGRGWSAAQGMPVDWSPKFEAAYQEMLPAMQALAKLPDDSAARLEFLRMWRPDYADAYYRFSKLRFMRLCAHLRKREPDDMAGYSILMFNLSDDDVRRMTEGPPPDISAARQ